MEPVFLSSGVTFTWKRVGTQGVTETVKRGGRERTREKERVRKERERELGMGEGALVVFHEITRDFLISHNS